MSYIDRYFDRFDSYEDNESYAFESSFNEFDDIDEAEMVDEFVEVRESVREHLN